MSQAAKVRHPTTRPVASTPSAPELGGRRVVVVMPAYNASETLRETWQDIPKEWVHRVILVDDASRDTTLDVARALKVDVIAHPHNVGYGGNQKTCYLEALRLGADVVIMLHPDGQYDPAVIPELVRPVRSGQADLVLGSRFLVKGNARQ